MTTTAIRHAIAVGLAGALALNATCSAVAQIRGEAGTVVAQFCIPPESPDAHRFYCRNASG
jgi:hypothetical protein